MTRGLDAVRVTGPRGDAIELRARHTQAIARLIALLTRNCPSVSECLRPCRLALGSREERPRALFLRGESLQ